MGNAEALLELHLSHNEIDDESALELLRTLHSPVGKRHSKSWADIQSGDEEDTKETSTTSDLQTSLGNASNNPDKETEHWTQHRMEKIARRSFELRRHGDHWGLRISMGGLDPPLTELGMERYCRWLRARLTAFGNEHGAEALRHCRGEVDFSRNNMSNQMVWMLLETLAQHEIHPYAIPV